MKQINKTTLLREVANLKMSDLNGQLLVLSQFNLVKSDLCEIIKLGNLEHLKHYIYAVPNHRLVSQIFKGEISTTSSTPMISMMTEIYSALSILVSYSRSLGIEVENLSLIPMSKYKDFLIKWAVQNKHVSKDICDLINWDDYIHTMSRINQTVHLSVSKTFFANEEFIIHYENAVTKKIANDPDFLKPKVTEKMSIQDYLNKTNEQNNPSQTNRNAIKNPFRSNRNYGTYKVGSYEAPMVVTHSEEVITANEPVNTPITSNQIFKGSRSTLDLNTTEKSKDNQPKTTVIQNKEFDDLFANFEFSNEQ